MVWRSEDQRSRAREFVNRIEAIVSDEAELKKLAAEVDVAEVHPADRVLLLSRAAQYGIDLARSNALFNEETDGSRR